MSQQESSSNFGKGKQSSWLQDSRITWSLCASRDIQEGFSLQIFNEYCYELNKACVGGANTAGVAADPFALNLPAPSSQPPIKAQAKNAPMAKQGTAANQPSTAKNDPFADLFG